MDYIKAFIVGGIFCLIGQILIDKTKLTPARILVSYVVAPASGKSGSYCYKMLIEPQTNTLYYFRKHKITKKAGPGFLAEDIRRIAVPRKK